MSDKRSRNTTSAQPIAPCVACGFAGREEEVERPGYGPHTCEKAKRLETPHQTARRCHPRSWSDPHAEAAVDALEAMRCRDWATAAWLEAQGQPALAEALRKHGAALPKRKRAPE